MPLKVRLVVRTAHGGCTTLKWNRRRDVGQAGSRRGGWLPPLSAAIAAGGRLTIGRSLPSCPTGAPPAWRTTYAQMQVLLLIRHPHRIWRFWTNTDMIRIFHKRGEADGATTGADSWLLGLGTGVSPTARCPRQQRHCARKYQHMLLCHAKQRDHH